jgi:asparagine synthase (glutamine-hydrolysing)
MCGLFAAWTPQSLKCDSVLAALHRRGPDDQGQWLQPVAGGVLQMLHTRLAIQDLTPAGHQPMQSTDQRFTLIFNGEIYNAPELRLQLERIGVRFRSHSDTEVLLAGFVHWGVTLFPRLNGIFALAIWDAEQAAFTLARDRFGVKPLLWWRAEGGWAIASELAALRAAGLPPRPRLDRHALEQFWQWGAAQAPRTLIADVRSVPPGSWARWQVHDPADRWQLHTYAGLDRAETLTAADLSYAEAVQEVAEALDRAVDRQMLADVPVGAFLSGGLDSSALVALMAARRTTPVRTFSLGFRAEDLGSGVVDERSLAACTARLLGSDHCELVLSADQIRASLAEFVDAIDQPSVDGLNTFLVARAARAHGLTVAVSGLGGDELFAGYPVFNRAWRFQLHGGRADALLAAVPWRLQQRLGWQHHRFASGSVAALAAHRRLQAGALPAAMALLPEELSLDSVAQVSRLELRGYLSNTLLRDSDAVTMHHGLELRVPFLDNDLVDLLLRLPSAYKFRPGCTKPLLRDSIGARLPAVVLQAPKRGFELPIGRWLRDEPQPVLRPQELGGLWPQRVDAAWRRYRSRPHRYHGWWQWHVLSRWLMAWPELLDHELGSDV